MDSRAQNNIQDLVLKGTAATPGIAFLGDGNTGVYSPGADQIAIATGGVSALSVDASQNVALVNPLRATQGGTGLATYTTGDILYASAANTISKLPIGANNYVLTVSAGVPAWTAAAASGVSSVSFGSTGLTPSTATTGAVSVAGTLVSGSGGTGFSTYAQGDILYASAANTVSKLAVGSAGQVLTVSGGAPVWATAAASGVSSISFGSTGLTPSTSTTGAVTVAGTLALASGGTGSTTQSGARTAIGLGTIATQDASSVSITGGTISGASSIAASGGITSGARITAASGVVGSVGYAFSTGTSSFTSTGTDLNVNFTSSTSLYSSGSGATFGISVGGGDTARFTSSKFTLGPGITSAECYFGTTWTNISDARVKTDVTPYAIGVSALNQLRPVNYIYNGDYGTPENGIVQTGLIAQEVLTTPLASMVGTRVYTDPQTGQQTTLYDLNTNQLVFALINAVKELDARVKALEAKVP